MTNSPSFIRISKIILIFTLILSSISLGFSQITYANTSDSKEKELEKEVNAYVEEFKKSQDSSETKPENAKIKAANAESQCMVSYMSASYRDALSTAAIIALYDDPSWGKFKSAAKQIISSGAKGTVVGVAYELYQAHQFCAGAGTGA